MLDGPIFLTGFMGVGKSQIGKLLARRLGRVFMDTDEMVEARAGQSIFALFAAGGEERFRQLERECLAEAVVSRLAVIALGGGAIVQEGSWEIIRRTSGVLVCLEADVDTILERVNRSEDRPLLAGLSGEEKRGKIDHLLKVRAPFYARADIKILTSNDQAPEKVVEQLIQRLEQWDADHRSGA